MDHQEVVLQNRKRRTRMMRAVLSSRLDTRATPVLTKYLQTEFRANSPIIPQAEHLEIPISDPNSLEIRVLECNNLGTRIPDQEIQRSIKRTCSATSVMAKDISPMNVGRGLRAVDARRLDTQANSVGKCAGCATRSIQKVSVK
jgi:hypothetical protein